MIGKRHVKKKVFVSILTVFLLTFVSFPFSPKVALAAAVSWDGGAGNGLWESATNWSNDAVPTTSDDVTIDNAAVTLSSGQIANFSTLTIGLGINVTSLTLTGNIGTGGSITIANGGVMTQKNITTQIITGTLTVQSGGKLTHTANGSLQDYEVDFSAANITIDAGGSIDVDAKGYSAANGPTGGKGAGNNCAGGGGAHGGDGGDSQTWNSCTSSGGASYGDITNPSTIGAGGNGKNGTVSGTGSQGGGLIKLNVTGTLTISGTITADGAAGNGGSGGYGDGGGAGGAVNITTGTIAGTPQSFTVTGGAGTNTTADGGSGGGGLVFISYVTDSSSSGIIDASGITMSGGAATSGEGGGAGVVLVKTPSTDGTLFVKNGATAGLISQQTASSLTVDSIKITSNGVYKVPSGKTFILDTSTPLNNGDDTGKLIIDDSSIFTSPTTFTIANTTLEFHQSATWTSASSTALTMGADGVLDFRDFTTSTTITFSTVTVQNTGKITNGSNTTAQSHVINLIATTMTIDSGGSIDVDAKGYSANNGTGNGGGNNCAGGGGAHGGNGGASQTWGECTSSGGTAYGSSTNPATIGSGGGTRNGNTAATGSQGGGLIKLNITGTLTINGTITADGAASTGSNGGYGFGGGAGGGINVSAATLAGTPQSITVTGGNASNEIVDGGGGGGGLAYFAYSASTSISTSNVTITAGTSTSGSAGSVGIVSVIQLTPSAPTTLFTNNTDASAGSANPTTLTTLTPVFSAICNTVSGQCTLAQIEVDNNSDFSSPIWQSENIDIVDVSNSARSGNITYAGSQLSSNVTYYWRIKFHNSSGAGSWSAGTDTFYISNTAPTLTAITPTQSSASAVTMTTTMADVDLNTTSATAQYSTDNSTWNNATLSSVTEGGEGDGVTLAAGSISGIDTNNDGSVNLTISWDIVTDLNNTEDSTVYFRLTPNDGTASGTTVTSAAFAVDTKAPTVPGALTFVSSNATTAILRFGAASTDANFAEYKIYYNDTGNPGVLTTNRLFSQTNNAILASINYGGATSITITDLNRNTSHAANIWAFDSFGRSSYAESEVIFANAEPPSDGGGGVVIGLLRQPTRQVETRIDNKAREVKKDERREAKVRDDQRKQEVVNEERRQLLDAANSTTYLITGQEERRSVPEDHSQRLQERRYNVSRKVIKDVNISVDPVTVKVRERPVAKANESKILQAREAYLRKTAGSTTNLIEKITSVALRRNDRALSRGDLIRGIRMQVNEVRSRGRREVGKNALEEVQLRDLPRLRKKEEEKVRNILARSGRGEFASLSEREVAEAEDSVAKVVEDSIGKVFESLKGTVEIPLLVEARMKREERDEESFKEKLVDKVGSASDAPIGTGRAEQAPIGAGGEDRVKDPGVKPDTGGGGGGAIILINRNTKIQFSLSLDKAKKARKEVRDKKENVLVVDTSSDLDNNGVSDLLQIVEGQPLFVSDPDDDGFEATDEIFFGGSPLRTDRFEDLVPVRPRITNLPEIEDLEMESVETGASPIFWISGQIGEEVILSLVSLDNRDTIFVSEPEVINLDFKAAVQLENLPKGGYYLVLTGNKGVSTISKIKVNPDLDGEAELALGEDEVLEGRMKPGSTVYVTWKSLVLNSVVIADSSAGKFEITPPAGLDKGEHSAITYYLDSKKNFLSSAKRQKFLVRNRE